MKGTELGKLLAKAQAGDQACYRKFLEVIMELLQRYFSAALKRYPGHDRAWVADLVQETTLAVHLKRATYDPKQELLPWLYGIARYKFIDHLRRAGKEHIQDEVNEETFGIQPPLPLEWFDLPLLQSCLAQLSEREQTLVQLLKLEGRSIKEVSASLSMSESNVKVSVHRAMSTLRQLLTEKGL
jgi:RNA polymerase sigma-70 factor (ECF subfamily)